MAEVRAPMSLAETLAFYKANGIDPVTGARSSTPLAPSSPELPTPMPNQVGPNIDQPGPIGDVAFDAMPAPGSPAAAMAQSPSGSTLDPTGAPLVVEANPGGIPDGVDPTSNLPIDPYANPPISVDAAPIVAPGNMIQRDKTLDGALSAGLLGSGVVGGTALGVAIANRKKAPKANSADKPGNKFGIDNPSVDPRAATHTPQSSSRGYMPQQLLEGPDARQPTNARQIEGPSAKPRSSNTTDDVIYQKGPPQRRLPAPQAQGQLPAPNRRALSGPPAQGRLPKPDVIYSGGPTYPSDRIYAGAPGPEYIDQKLLPDLNEAGRARGAAGYKQPLPEKDVLMDILARRFKVNPNQLRSGAKAASKLIR